MDAIWSFLNSNIGTLAASTLVAGVALFTWQRNDWRSKQEYKRREVLLDRRIQLVETVVKDAAGYLAHAANVLVAVQKGIGGQQLNALILGYNDEQAKWFAATEAHRALTALYLPDVVREPLLGDVIDATQAMDLAIYHATQDPEKVVEGLVLLDVLRENLRSWSASAWQYLPEGPHRAS